MHRARLAGLGALVLVSAVGCGGGADTFSLSATQTCLEKAGYQTAVVKNRYLPGSAGNLRVRLSNRKHLLAPGAPGGGGPGDDYVFLVFDKNAAGALATQEKALALAIRSIESQGQSATRASVKRGVGQTKNVFYYSAGGALSQADRLKVASCLE